MIFLVISFLAMAWCLGGILALRGLEAEWNANINGPWIAAIEAKDWDACDKYHKAARYHIDHMMLYTLSPFHWFRVPKENE